MPLQNRVAPNGALLADAARGTLFGNRGGRFHDPATRTLGERRYASRQWICCVLAFKGRRRAVWGRGYTELFFCDEVTALAAGHRPCMECRRADALAYREALVRGLGLARVPHFPEIDMMLDSERRDGRRQLTRDLPARDLPDGAMIVGEGGFLAIAGEHALPWSPSGYGQPRPRPEGKATVLTPPMTLAALAAGFRPRWHPSASRE